MSRASGDIDPRRLDVEPKRRRRRRKDRAKPDPKPALKADEAKATARAKRRPLSPGVMLEPGKHGWRTESPHNDPNLWELQLADAFGTRSHSVMRVFMRDLRRLCSQDWDEDLDRWKANETELNAALAMVADIQPQNTAEAALAAQMVAIHWMQMRLTQQALNNGGMIMEKDAALASKLARTYTMQLDALQGMRGGKKPSRQSIRVKRESHHHQHIHIHREGDAGKTDEQPQEARAATVEGRAALSGPREVHGQVVPFAGRAREEGLPQARRSKPRSAEGEG